MANDLIRTEFIRRVSSALARAQDISPLNHPGLIGHAREVFVKDLLKPVLPQIVAKVRPRFGEYIIRLRDFVKL